MITTDYTEHDTFQPGFTQQYRIQKYFKDIINNWFADKRNIKDQRLLSLMYDSQGNLNKDCIKTGCPFNPDGKYAGTTPAVIVSLGNIQYTRFPVSQGANLDFTKNPTEAIVEQLRYKLIPMNITVITQSYDGTILLAELLQLFLTMNSQSILADCSILSFIRVTGISAPTPVPQGQSGNAKQLYSSAITISTGGIVTWCHDTQGPVFRGLTVSTTYK